MNKEEMFKNLSDKDKKEVLSLMSFMKKFKEQERNKELYATYEEYLDLIHINKHLNDENKKLQSQLDIANKKLEEINEIVSSYGIQTIPSGLGECPVEVTTYELNNIYKLSIIGGNNE